MLKLMLRILALAKVDTAKKSKQRAPSVFVSVAVRWVVYAATEAHTYQKPIAYWRERVLR